jgi:ABC-type multidrug transport system permease subunit
VSESLRTISTIASNDFKIWIRRPLVIFTTLVPSIMYIFVIYFISITVGEPPVALVDHGTGPQAARLVQIMRTSGDFRLSVLPQPEAQARYRSFKVAAVITIPASFDRAFSAHRVDAVHIEMNNVNQDIAADLRRSLAATLSDLYAAQPVNPLPVSTAESNVYTQDITLAQFRIVPGIVLILMLASSVNTALATREEFERRTIKELTLAPIPRWTIVFGKIYGGWLTTILIGTILLLVTSASGLFTPAPLFWIPSIAMILIIALAGSALGAAVGAVVPGFHLVTSVSITIPLYLFFSSGGFSVPGFLPSALQTVSHFVPLYYGVKALEDAVFSSSVAHLAADALITLAFTIIAAAIALVAMRRPLMR